MPEYLILEASCCLKSENIFIEVECGFGKFGQEVE